ncbi:MAG TPA: cupin [Clostridiales bacterium]|nr:cupin [Clostridiales bacterium]
MIKRENDMVTEIRERMRGGEGQVIIKHLFKPGEFAGNARLCAHLTLGPGCSIGLHDHQHEEEIFYIIAGEGLLLERPDGPEQVLRSGDAAINQHGSSHSIRNGSDQPLELLALILLTP